MASEDVRWDREFCLTYDLGEKGPVHVWLPFCGFLLTLTGFFFSTICCGTPADRYPLDPSKVLCRKCRVILPFPALTEKFCPWDNAHDYLSELFAHRYEPLPLMVELPTLVAELEAIGARAAARKRANAPSIDSGDRV